MRLIDFEKARKEVLAVLAGKVNTVIAIKVVEALKKSTIEAEPVRHGRWVHAKTYYDLDECNCSLCGQLMTTEIGKRMNYCPNCGAKMDKGDDDATN